MWAGGAGPGVESEGGVLSRPTGGEEHAACRLALQALWGQGAGPG